MALYADAHGCVDVDDGAFQFGCKALGPGWRGTWSLVLSSTNPLDLNQINFMQLLLIMEKQMLKQFY